MVLFTINPDYLKRADFYEKCLECRDTAYFQLYCFEYRLKCKRVRGNSPDNALDKYKLIEADFKKQLAKHTKCAKCAVNAVTDAIDVVESTDSTANSTTA